MRLTTHIATLLLLALLLGAAGPLKAGCAACPAAEASETSGCHGGGVLKALPACCSGPATAERCFGQIAALPGAVLPVPVSNPDSSCTQDLPTAAARLFRLGDAAPVHLYPDPLLQSGAGLFILHCVFLI